MARVDDIEAAVAQDDLRAAFAGASPMLEQFGAADDLRQCAGSCHRKEYRAEACTATKSFHADARGGPMSSPMTPPRAQNMAMLVRAQRLWDAAAAAAAEATTAVDDPDVLVLAAEIWAKLGVAALSTRSLDRLCSAFPAASENGRVAACRDIAASTPDNELSPPLLRQRVQEAAALLDRRIPGVAAAADRWCRDNQHTRVFLANDGNPVRMRRDGRIELVGDHRAASRALIEQHRDALRQSLAPITIEGFDPPWLALDLASATAADTAGDYSPGLRIVQADPLELLDGVSLIEPPELRSLAEQDRVEWFIGPAAATELAAAITAEPGLAHSGPTVPLATLRTPIGGALGSCLRDASDRFAREHTAHVTAIRSRDSESAAAARVRAIAKGSPRVALIAGRFTTVLAPMVADLAAAFRAVGASTRIITEPSDHRRLTALAYSRVFAEFDPDLIVCANHTRDDADRLLQERVMPRGVPWVTWVQDAMPHLLKPDAGRSIGPMDLAIGHIAPAMRAELGYRGDRSISVPMVASETKFSADHADAALRDELACEIAAFTNHSETPEAMRARLIDEVSSSTDAASLVERVADAALMLAAEPVERVHGWERCEAIVASAAPGVDAETRENLIHNVAFRVYDRACRHLALSWASSAAERNGWRFAIYGRGWDANPSLGAHARGVLRHGPELCSAYAAARVTMDATVLTSLHQRVAECVLAGGLPSVLATGSAIAHARGAIKRRLVAASASSGTPVAEMPGQVAVPLYRSEDGRRFAALGSMLNGRSYPYAFVEPHSPLEAEPPGVLNTDDAVGLVELGVTGVASIERLVTRAADASWRESQRARVLGFVRANCTHAVLARRILDHYASMPAAASAAA